MSRVGLVLKHKWRLDELVGWGGVAAVYSATHRNQSRVAIKILHDELALSPSIRERFLREGYAANAVGHRSAVQILDDDVTDDGLVFLVMELLTGETLADRLDHVGGRIAWPEALRITTDILSVLDAAHEKGIIHRDLKPENVYLTEAGETKILDFGLARILTDNGEHTGTRVGLTMGTRGSCPRAAARAMARGGRAQRSLGARRDVFNILAEAPRLRGRRCPVRAPTAPTARPRLGCSPGGRRDRRPRPLAAALVSIPISGEMLHHPGDRGGQPRHPFERTPAHHPRQPDDAGAHLDGGFAAGDARQRAALRGRALRVLGRQARPSGDLPQQSLVAEQQRGGVSPHPGAQLRHAAVVSAKVGSLVGGMGAVTGMFINHQDPDVGSSAAMISNRYAPDASIFCSDPTWRLIVHLNLPRDRFVDLDRHRHGFRFGQDDLLPVPSPFCHFRGAVMLYDPSTRVLFTGDFLGGVTEPGAHGVWADKSDWSGIRAFHQTYMPTQRVLANTVRAIRELDMPIDIVAPQHGRLLRGGLIHDFLDRLERLPVGLDLMDDIGDGADALAASSSVFNRILHTAEMVMNGAEVAAAARHEAIAEHLQFRGERAEVLSAGRWTVSNLVRLLVQRRPPSVANAITLEALHACDEIELPSPEIQLDMGSPREPRATEAALEG